MEAFFRREWQRQSIWQIGLRPVSWLFGLLAAMRRALFKSGFLRTEPVGVPVLVVGNISLGGTGKTPVVVALCTHFAAWHPGVVSRGYKSGETSDGGAGDEALLASQRTGVPVVTNPDRVAAARTLLASHPDTRLIIADDGLQHYRLARDIEIAVVDAETGFGNGCLLPAGPLREPVSRLAKVDCLVLNATGVAEENTSNGAVFEAKMAESARRLATLQSELAAIGRPVFTMRYGNERFRTVAAPNVDVAAAEEVTTFLTRVRAAGFRIAAVAGIGRPERFFMHLESLGLSLHSRHAFDDHHAFTADDLKIDADLIVMTEKDAVKCRDFGDSRLWMMQIDALLPPPFFDFIQARLAAAKTQAS